MPAGGLNSPAATDSARAIEVLGSSSLASDAQVWAACSGGSMQVTRRIRVGSIMAPIEYTLVGQSVFVGRPILAWGPRWGGQTRLKADCWTFYIAPAAVGQARSLRGPGKPAPWREKLPRESAENRLLDFLTFWRPVTLGSFCNFLAEEERELARSSPGMMWVWGLRPWGESVPGGSGFAGGGAGPGKVFSRLRGWRGCGRGWSLCCPWCFRWRAECAPSVCQDSWGE